MSEWVLARVVYVAQLVEHWPRKPRDPGLTPGPDIFMQFCNKNLQLATHEYIKYYGYQFASIM